MNDQYYTVKEVAELKGVCPETVRRWIRKGYLPARINSKKQGYMLHESDFKHSLKEAKHLNSTVIDIIELFEDFLDDRGIKIENPEKEESENPSTIYGTDFGELFEGIKDILKS